MMMKEENMFFKVGGVYVVQEPIRCWRIKLAEGEVRFLNINDTLLLTGDIITFIKTENTVDNSYDIFLFENTLIAPLSNSKALLNYYLKEISDERI